MTILDEIQTSIRQHALGAGSSVVGIGQRRGIGSGIGADERTVQVMFTPEIEGQ
jgi:hypothetical protein